MTRPYAHWHTVEAVHGILDGEEWLHRRIRFLEEELGSQVDAARRAQIADEIAKLKSELEDSRRRRWRSRIFGGRRAGM